MNIEKLIRQVPDFPKPGISFKDISPILANADAFSEILNQFSERIIKNQPIDAIIGIEARGFVLAAALAAKNNLGFIPMRKKGKLPPPTVSYSYALEYGQDTLELARPEKPMRVAIVDDVLAIGGTLGAAVELCRLAGHAVQSIAVLIDLRGLNSFKFKGAPVVSLLSY